jgi:hypothetical protein
VNWPMVATRRPRKTKDEERKTKDGFFVRQVLERSEGQD